MGQMAMLVSDRLDNHSILRHIAYQIGFLFQSQDDVLDVFGDPKVTGKVGTDIQDGKCTWPSVRSVQKLHGTPELDDFKAGGPDIFEPSHYGEADPESVSRIKKLMHQLKLREEFANFEKRYSDKAGVKADIDRLPERLSTMRPVLHEAVDNLIDRKK
ncbi:hypothetical protein NECAME_00802 [Necator americanus]|uniref:Polyprenyl synthetase n=1 Tax=Necator americanus TaxID=51031 RepID=W2SVZ3_NECAM|nr:hypothetical protein NECAME_00802 [Necator americanus]ETN73713.1 hypothetical protein NECAME_00802 [Necator americanus]